MKRRPLALPFVFTAMLSPGLALADASPPNKPKLPRAVHPERVHKNPDGTCVEYPDTSCPPGVHCNPGPPRDVECPPEPPKKK